MWTADGQYILFTSTEGFSNGIATQGGITASTELWVLALRDRDRDPGNRDIDNEAQGLAAQAEARRNNAGGNGRCRKCASTGAGWRAARKQLTVPGNAIGSLTPAPEGPFVALTIGNRDRGWRRWRPGWRRRRACTSSTSRAASSRACRARRRTTRSAAAATRAVAAAASAADRRSCSRATRARCTSDRAPGLYAAAINLQADQTGRRRRAAGRRAAATRRSKSRPAPTRRRAR